MSDMDAVGSGHLEGRPFGCAGEAEHGRETCCAPEHVDGGCHPGPDLLSRYVRGDVDEGGAIALERHLMSCSSCRASLGQFADPECLERGWEAVLEAVNAPRPGLLERLLTRFGMSDTTARLVAATPSLRASWLTAVALVLGFAVLAARKSPGEWVFLVVAPLLPVIGVAAAYGPCVDPTYEIGLAAPLNSLRLLLLRAAAVLTTTTLMGTTAAVVGLAARGSIQSGSLMVVVWLLPALGLTAGSIALSTVMYPLHAARLVALAWLILVAVHARLDQPPAQIAFALLAVGAGLVIAVRREVLDQGRAG